MRKLLVLLFFVITILSLKAEIIWEEDGKAIRRETNLNWEGASLELSDGSRIIVWNDAASGLQEIKAQKLDTDGQPVWNADGIIISGNSGRPHHYRLVKDDSDNVFIAWLEDNLEDFKIIICLQKIDANGNILWNNKKSYIEQFNLGHLEALTDDEDGIYLVWVDDFLWSLHLDSDGDLMEGWEETGNQINQNGMYSYYPEIVSDGNGGLICAYISRIEPDYSLYMQRIANSGEVCWENDLEIVNYGNWNHTIDIIKNYNDEIVLSYIIMSDDSNNVYAQKFDIFGNYLWDEALLISSDFVGNNNLHLIESEADNYYIGWDDEYYLDDNFYRINLMKFNDDGLCWDEPYTIETSYYNITIEQILGAGAEGCWLLLKKPEPEVRSLYLYMIDNTGSSILPQDGIMLSSNYYSVDEAIISSTDSEEVLINWYNHSDGMQSINIQKVDTDGNLFYDEGGVSIYSRIGGTTSGYQFTGNENYSVVVWEEYRFPEMETLCMQIIENSSGEYLFEENGIIVVNTESDIENYQAAFLQDNCQTGITWIDRDQDKAMMQIVDIEGNLYYGETGIQLKESDTNSINSPSLCMSSYENGFNITWKDYDYDLISDNCPTIQRVENGELVWGENGISIDGCECEFELEDCMVVSNYFIFLDSFFGMESQCYVWRYDNDGTLSEGWSETGVTVNSYETILKLISADETENGLLLLWLDNRIQPHRVYGQLISSDGEVCWCAAGIPLYDNDNSIYNFVSAATDDNFYLSWTENQSGIRNIKLMKFDFECEMVWDEPVVLYSGTEFNSYYQLAVNDEIISLYLPLEDPVTELNDLHAKYFYTDGTVCEGIGENGIVVSDEIYCQHRSTVNQWDGTDYLVWRDERGQKFTESADPSLYIQKITLPEIVDAGENGIVEFVKISNYPNPFNGTTKLEYTLPRSVENAEIMIYNVKGQLVRKLTADNSETCWDCRDFSGKAVGSGVYFYRITGEEFYSRTEKMILVR